MTNEAARYAYAFRLKGYYPYPVNVGVDGRGDKTLTFKDNRWADGEYPMGKEDIGRHWEGFSGVMLNTGKSGIVVVDIDRKKGVDGFAGLVSVGVEIPQSPMWAETPNDGEHRFYRAPEGVDVKTCAGILAPGVDIRAKGGLVLTAPTEVPGKGAYKLHNVTAVEDLPEFPRDLVRLLNPSADRATSERTPLTEPPLLTSEQRQWFERKMDSILRELRHMEEGERFGTMQRRMVRLYGIAMSLQEDLDVIDDLCREAYYGSGGVDSRQLEGWIKWSREHADYEEPIDEDREAEIQRLIRLEEIREEVKKRRNPVRFDEISDDDVLTFDPTSDGPKWWVDGWVPKGVTGILFAPPNTGKSFAAMDLACGVATGSRVWGRKASKGRVLFLAGEGHTGLPVRQEAWKHHFKADPGNDVILQKMKLNLADESSVTKHVELVQKVKADVIVVDTLRRAMAAMVAENTNEASLAIRHLDIIREAAGPEATLLALHHPAKHNPSDPAGSYPIEGNVDTILGMIDKDNKGNLEMWVKKARDADKSARINLRQQSVDVGNGFGSLVLVPVAEGVSEVEYVKDAS